MHRLYQLFGDNFQLKDPVFLWLFLLLIPLLILDLRKKQATGLRIPQTTGMKSLPWMNGLLFFFKATKYVILSALILGLARPQTYSIHQETDDSRGIDIMLSVDISYSMLAKDLNPDRLTALQGIADKFVEGRPGDRVGLVAYAGEGFLKVPLTTDHEVVKREINRLDPEDLEGGTAIGEGLAVAVNHLKDSPAKSKVIILMTDGVQTIFDSLDPKVATELAVNNHIKVYTIGIGTNGYALTPTSIDFFGGLVYSEQKVEIDEPMLRNIAKRTGGRYFRATSNDSLQQIYDEINQLEKSKIKTNTVYDYTEYFRICLWIAWVVLCLDVFLRWMVFKIFR